MEPKFPPPRMPPFHVVSDIMTAAAKIVLTYREHYKSGRRVAYLESPFVYVLMRYEYQRIGLEYREMAVLQGSDGEYRVHAQSIFSLDEVEMVTQRLLMMVN